MNTFQQQKFMKDQLDLGKSCLEKGDFRGAIKFLTDVVDSDEKNVEAHFLLATAYHSTGQISKALKIYRHVLKIDPNHTSSAISLSIILNDIGRYDEAKSIFEHTSARVKSDSSGVDDFHVNKVFCHKHEELGDLYMTYQRYIEAGIEYQKILQLDPEQLSISIKLAKIYVKRGLTQKALELLRGQKNTHPHHLETRMALGLILYGQGKVVEAQSEWQKVLSMSPTHTQAKLYLEISKSAQETTL